MPSPVTQKKSPEMIMPEPVQHEHAHRRAIIIGVTLLALVVIGGIIYKYIANQRTKERALRAQYQTEQAAQMQSFFEETLKNSGEPTTDVERKSIEVFFNANTNQSGQDPAQVRAQFDQMRAMAETNYQEWKAAQAN